MAWTAPNVVATTTHAASSPVARVACVASENFGSRALQASELAPGSKVRRAQRAATRITRAALMISEAVNPWRVAERSCRAGALAE
eukprot:6203278-Pleurochrysis_carterae.AAC.3